MKRKRLLILAGVALALAVLVPAALHLHPYYQKLARSRLIDLRHFARIKEGMSRAEVEAILGGPPGDFRTDERISYRSYFDADLSVQDVVARRRFCPGTTGKSTSGSTSKAGYYGAASARHTQCHRYPWPSGSGAGTAASAKRSAAAPAGEPPAAHFVSSGGQNVLGGKKGAKPQAGSRITAGSAGHTTPARRCHNEWRRSLPPSEREQ
jgi:hypothetical protein